tara:strand:+ start:2121 stop:2282 length:162 start_codon:yes stop_codon:yes gene_type:complete
MFIRNYKGEIKNFQQDKYKNEKSLYKALWLELFNINLVNKGKLDDIVNYVKNA